VKCWELRVESASQFEVRTHKRGPFDSMILDVKIERWGETRDLVSGNLEPMSVGVKLSNDSDRVLQR
jgi:hypothetical protein